MKDAEAILSHVFSRTDIDTKRVFLHGRSLGGAVSVYSAAELKYPVSISPYFLAVINSHCPDPTARRCDIRKHIHVYFGHG